MGTPALKPPTCWRLLWERGFLGGEAGGWGGGRGGDPFVISKSHTKASLIMGPHTHK